MLGKEANVDTVFENDVIPLHAPKPTVNFETGFQCTLECPTVSMVTDLVYEYM